MKKLSVLLLIMSFVGNSFGQNLDNEELFEMSLEELMDVAVISASKTAEKSSNAPSTIYAISKEQISVRGYSTLEELLEDIPEIEIQRKSVTEYSNYFTFRGIAGNERFLILQNGVRIASVTGSPHAITHNYPVAHAERVEVILGPASALYGADAFTGIVNIITQSGEKVDGGTLTASYGSFNTTDNSFVAGGGNEKVAVMATGKFYSSDEPNMSDFYEDEYSWYLDEYSQNGNVIMSPDFQDTIGTSGIKDYKTPTQAYFINTQISIDDVQIGYIRNYEAHNSSVAGKPEYNVYSQDATYNVMNQIIYLQHDYTSDNSKWNVQSTLSHSLYELEPESKFINTFTNFSEGFKYANSQKFKFDEKVSYSFTDNYKLMAGFTFEDINALPKTGDLPFKYDPDLPSDLQDFYYLGTNITNGTGEDLTIMQDFYHLKYQNYGGYLQFQGKISEQLRFVAGGRVDYNTRYGASVNPRAGIVSKPIDKLSIKLLYGRAYLAPSPYNAYQHYGAFVYNSDNDELTIPFWHLANPDLKPETINTFEINAGYYLTDNIGVFIDGYYNSAKNLVVMEGSFDEVFHGIPVGYAHIAQNN
jgi:outer membrane receptor for ferrienterochelin and colicin